MEGIQYMEAYDRHQVLISKWGFFLFNKMSFSVNKMLDSNISLLLVFERILINRIEEFQMIILIHFEVKGKAGRDWLD